MRVTVSVMTSRLSALARAISAAAAVLVAAAGCSVPQGGAQPKAPTGTVEATKAPTADLSKYYSQKLRWAKCGGANECADLTVPLDYAKPGTDDITIKVLRVKARDQGKRLGSLVVNPGGPGGSGVDYAAAADNIVGTQVRRYYDVVGFDPRGVGRSAAVDCLNDRALDDFLGYDPTPDNASEEQGLLREVKAMASGCEARSAKLLPHVGTVDAARDMDVLRAALGDAKLTYLGKSYGTFLGSTYAELFPKRVGRFVLDGVVPPDLTSEEMAEGQARGFEMATRAYVKDCVDQGNCILGSSVDEGMQWIRTFLKRLDARPIPSGDSAAPRLTEAWGSLGLGAALYDQGAWGILTEALKDAQAGDGSALMALADTYADRQPGGRYSGNIMEVIYAVNCLDRPDSPDLASYRAYAEKFSKSAPTWGDFLAWGNLACGNWPVKEVALPGAPPVGPHKIRAEGSDTIVVVGTTRDPATIYEWSKRLRDQLANAVLVSFDGDGHTAYRRSNDCVDNAIDAYYVEGRTPKDGLTC
jgi:pimeloyl-ACP methyl ester carboxylesterase